MSRATATVTVRRPIAEVFSILTDVEQTGRWFPGDVEERWTSPPPHGLGSTRHATVRVLGRRSENDAVVTAFEPPRLAAMRDTTPGAEFDARLTFSEGAAGTRIAVVVELPARGVARLAMPVVVAWYQRQWRRGLVQLVHMMESGELRGPVAGDAVPATASHARETGD
jgi:uncharacterized protein YndB with AHSA1/START domain